MPAANLLGSPSGAAAPPPRSQYMPYNDDPRNVGSLTGKPMPTGLERDSDDYEDVLDYFPSDDMEHDGDATGSTSMMTSVTAGISRRDASGKTTSASAAIASRRTVVSAGPKTPTTGRSAGRSSRLGLMSDDEEGEGDYAEAASAGRTMYPQSPTSRRHGAANGLRPPPSVNQPAPSRLIPVSPDVNFDDLPSAPYQGSPTTGRRTQAGAPSSRRTVAQQSARGSSSRRVLDAGDEDEDEGGEAQGGEDPDETNESLGVEMGRNAGAASPRASRGGRSSRRADVRASAETEIEGGEEPTRGGELTGVDPSGYADEEVPLRDDYDAADDYDAGDGEAYEDASGGDGGDGDGADSPIDEGGSADDDDDAPEPVAKGKGGKDVKGKGKAKPRGETQAKAKAARATSVPRPKVDRNRERSQSEILQPADTLQVIPYNNDRKRRLRTADERTTPLEYWRGERPQYTRRIHDGDETIDAGTAVVEAWVRVPKEEPVHLGARARKARAKSKSRDVRVPKTIDEEGEDPYDVTGWDQTTEQSGLVLNFADNATVLRRIACTHAQLQPGAVLGANGENAFEYQKVFVEDPFFAAGIIHMDVGGNKSTKPARDNTYVFFVHKGCVEFSVHRTRSIVSEGGLFLIPRGNDYSLKNVCDKKVELFFSQARLLRNGEELPEMLANEVIPVIGGQRDAMGSPRVANGTGKAARRARADEDDEDGADRSLTPVAKKAKTATAKRR